jgi:hypothetical protein
MDDFLVYKCQYEKKRIGKDNDGGYVIAELPGAYDILISGGISNDISFERQFLDMCPPIHKCYAFDGTINGLPDSDERITFIKKNLGEHNTESLCNLNDYLTQGSNIFMKIDIEGHEFRLFPAILPEHFSNIKQLVLEIHTPADIQLYPDYFAGLGYIQNTHLIALLKLINKTHTLVHFHGNNGCKLQRFYNIIPLPHVFECTFIRNDFITEKVLNDEPFPTVLDMKNITHLPDFVFDHYPFCNKL